MRVIYKSVTIRDVLFDAPNTCSLTLYGAAPAIGAPIEVWVDANDPTLLFSGEIQTVDRTYKGRPDDGAASDHGDRRYGPREPPPSADALRERLGDGDRPDVDRDLCARLLVGRRRANFPIVSITFDGWKPG